MDVSVIIVNYNTLELTKNTIESVLEKTNGIEFEIILIDNASSDGSVKFFKNNFSNRIVFIENANNLGFGKANNIGINFAKGKYLFLLNSDTLLINNAIKTLYEFMENNLDVAVSGGNLYDLDNNPTHSYLDHFISLKDEIDSQFNIINLIKNKMKISKRKDFNYTSFSTEVAYITGADMMIRKEVLNEVGAFDPDFFMYFEESELSYRIKKAGYKIMSVPDAKIIHLEGKSFEFKEKRFQMITESKFKYYNKIYGKVVTKKVIRVMQIGYILRYIFTFKKRYRVILSILLKEKLKIEKEFLLNRGNKV